MSEKLPRGARRLVRIGSVERDVEEELGFHFAQTVEQLMEEGRSRGDAQAEARRRFGDERRYRRDLRSIDRGTARNRRWSERLGATGRMAGEAARSISRSPALTLGIVIAFALGIGANATMFGIIDRLLLRPPAHIEAADRITHLYFESFWANVGKRVASGTAAYPDFEDMKAAKSFSGLFAASDEELTIGTGESAEKVDVTLVSHGPSDVVRRALRTKNPPTA